MSDVPGKFRLERAGATIEGKGAIRLEAPRLLILSDERDLAFDLGEIERYAVGDVDLTLTFLDGGKLVLSYLGRNLPGLAVALRDAWRERLMDCLLLRDENELARFEGWARREAPAPVPHGPAQLRLLGNHLAVLPGEVAGYAVALSSVTKMGFDEGAYAYTVEAGAQRVVVSHLARETARFKQDIARARDQRAAHAAQLFSFLFPFLQGAALDQALALFRELHAVALGDLGRLDKRILAALAERAMEPGRKPYYGAMAVRAPAGQVHVVYKLVPPDQLETVPEPEPPADETSPDEAAAPEDEQEQEPLVVTSPKGEELAPLFSFLFPLAMNRPGAGTVVGWEATSSGGRATYFFRVDTSDPTAAVQAVNAALGRIGYRREPIFHTDAEVDHDPALRHVAIALRRVPELKWLRDRFVGRAIHRTVASWNKQIDKLLG